MKIEIAIPTVEYKHKVFESYNNEGNTEKCYITTVMFNIPKEYSFRFIKTGNEQIDKLTLDKLILEIKQAMLKQVLEYDPISVF